MHRERHERHKRRKRDRKPKDGKLPILNEQQQMDYLNTFSRKYVDGSVKPRPRPASLGVAQQLF